MVTLLLFISTDSYAIENTKINRESQAWRYLATVQVEKMMREIFSSLPGGTEEENEKFLQNLDIAAFQKEFHNTLVNVMTANELKAYADFYSSVDGQSATAKAPLLLKEFFKNIMPMIEEAEKKANK